MNIAQQGVLDPRGPIAAAERLILINASAIMLVVVPVIVLAIAQMGVHLVFFLHIGTGPDNTNNVLALAFGVLIVVLVSRARSGSWRISTPTCCRRLPSCRCSASRWRDSLQLLQIGDDVRACLRVVDPEEHPGSGNQCTGVGEPAIERRFIPGQAGILQRRRVGVILQAACPAPDHAAMSRAQIILIDGVAGLAALVQGLAVAGIANECAIRQCRRRCRGGNKGRCE